MSRQIPLTRGLSALVDDEDYDRVSRYAWYATAMLGKTHYAFHDPGVGPKVGMARMVVNAPAGMEVDHINGNALDNRKCNLRLATHKQNTWNRRKHVDNSAGFKGVSFTRNPPNLRRPWCASLFVSGRVGPYSSDGSRRRKMRRERTTSPRSNTSANSHLSTSRPGAQREAASR